MAGKVTVKIDGAAIASLKSMPESKALLRRCAERALTFQKATCPVDTGRMVKSLGIQEVNNGTILQVGVVLYDVPYARFVEEGHESRAGNWVPAQPFIRPSINAAREGLR